LLLLVISDAASRPALSVIALATGAANCLALAAFLRSLRRHSQRTFDEVRRGQAERIEHLDQELAARDVVLAAMGEGVWLFDPTGGLRYSNRAARDILGRLFYTTAEIPWAALREAILEVAGETHGRQPTRAATQFDTAGIAVEATALAAEPPGSVVVVLRDVTLTRNLERLRRDFVANASHELKTPVASILALSSVLRDASPNDPETVSGFLVQLENEAERLAALVHDLLELSRLENRSPSRDELRLDHIVATAVERLRRRAAAAGLGLHASIPGPITVCGSEIDLAHLVENLLDNALRYSPDGGEVCVSVVEVTGAAELTIEDTGIGIASRDLDRIFERFYRGDSARSRATGGTGLGLSIVRHIAEAHGGSVRCQSALGAGSAFTVRLPMAQFSPRSDSRAL